MDFWIFNAFLAFFAVYGIASFAGLLSERSGTVNIGLEGNMIIGGLVFSLIMVTCPGLNGVVGGPFLAILVGGLAACLFSTLFSWATINFMGDHIITGTAMNMIAPALSFIIMIPILGKASADMNSTMFIWMGEANSSINATAFSAFLLTIGILVLGIFILNRTSWGLRLKTSGENPYALETAGVSVAKTRWIVNYIVGFLAGIAGAIAMITMSSFTGTMTGMGYIAIAILILGQWRISGIMIGTVIMSAAFAFFNKFSWSASVPTDLMQIIPFVLPILFLIFIKLSGEKKFSRRFHDHIYHTPNNIKAKEFRFNIPYWKDKKLSFVIPSIVFLVTYYGFYWWIVYLSYWAVWGIPYLVAKQKNKLDGFNNYLLETESKFSIGAAPAAAGLSFKKDLR